MKQIKAGIYDTILIGLPFIIVGLLYSFQLIDPVLLPKFMGWGIYLLVSWSVLLVAKNQLIDNKVLSNGILAFLGLYLIISGLSLLKTRTLAEGAFEWFKGLFLFVFIVMLVFQFRHRLSWYKTGVTIGFMVLTYLASAFGFYQFLELSESTNLSHSATYAISGTFAHRNLYAEILFLTLPFNLYGFWRFKGVIRAFSILGAFLAFFIIILLMSRAVWLAVGGGAFVTIGLGFLLAFRKGQAKAVVKTYYKGIFKTALIIGLTVSVAIFTYSYYGSATAFKKQIVSIFQLNFTYGSIKDRIDLWTKSWEIIKNHPFTGVGLGDWEQALLKQGNKGMLSADNKTFFQRPHNDFLWVCSESGVIALMVYLGIFLSAFYWIVKRLYQGNANTDQTLLYLLVFALTGYGTYALFSFPKERIEHQILLGVILSLVILEVQKVSVNQEKQSLKSAGYFLGGGLLIALLTFGCFLGFERIKAEANTLNALQARLSQKPKLVVQYINKAESPFYKVDPMSTPLRWYSGSAWYKLKSYDKAFRDFKKAYKVNPYHMHVVNNLATLYEKKGVHDSAIKYYKKALELSPMFTEAALNLAAVYFNQNETKKALSTLRRIDYQAQNKKYKKYLETILKSYLRSLNEGLEHEKMQHVITGMLNNKEWLLEVYKKSLDSPSFRYQLFKDVIYVLEKEKGNISFEEAKQLKQKYLRHD